LRYISQPIASSITDQGNPKIKINIGIANRTWKQSPQHWFLLKEIKHA
jgi:hypothetical protein